MPKSRKKPSDTAITSYARDITSANKAPGGFGLGIPANLANGDVNERHGNGFYEWGSIKPKNAPTLLRGEGTYMYMFEFGDDAGFTQIMGCYIQTSPGLICRQAFAKSGGVQFAEWEWVNPPMDLNTEYRTTERYMRKPVYVKMVNLGEGTNGKTVNVGTTETIHVECRATYSGWSLPMPELPFGSTDKRLEHTNAQAFYSNANTVTIIKGSTCPAFTATAKVYYIKSTD